MSLVAYQGPLLDFGGVLTSGRYGRMAGFRTEDGRFANAIVRALTQLAEVEWLIGLV